MKVKALNLVLHLIIIALFATSGCAPAVKKVEEAFTPSVKSEKEMGREFAKEAEKKLSLVKDPDLVEYLYRIGKPIVEASSEGRYRFRFHIVKNSTINAFAVPGGHIYIYSGLISRARSAEELAAVMAHELGHVTHRHTAQMVGKGTLVNLVTLAAMIASRGQRAVTAGAMGAGQALMLKFSREFEREADRSAVFYLYRAGYDPHALIDLLDFMMKEQNFSTSEVPPYLLTHPVTPERMDNIENLIRVYGMNVARSRRIKDFYRFQALLRIHVTDQLSAMSFFRKQVKRDPSNPRFWHQLALAYDRYGLHEEALRAFNRALHLDPDLLLAWVDLAELEARMGRLKLANEHLKRALSIKHTCAQAYVTWGKIHLRLNEPGQAKRYLKMALSLDPFLITAHQWLAKAKKQMKDEGGFHLEMASFEEKMDRTEVAISHLKKAMKLYGPSTPQGMEIKKRIERLKAS